MAAQRAGPHDLCVRTQGLPVKRYGTRLRRWLRICLEPTDAGCAAAERRRRIKTARGPAAFLASGATFRTPLFGKGRGRDPPRRCAWCFPATSSRCAPACPEGGTAAPRISDPIGDHPQRATGRQPPAPASQRACLSRPGSGEPRSCAEFGRCRSLTCRRPCLVCWLYGPPEPLAHRAATGCAPGLADGPGGWVARRLDESDWEAVRAPAFAGKGPVPSSRRTVSNEPKPGHNAGKAADRPARVGRPPRSWAGLRNCEPWTS